MTISTDHWIELLVVLCALNSFNSLYLSSQLRMLMRKVTLHELRLKTHHDVIFGDLGANPNPPSN